MNRTRAGDRSETYRRYVAPEFLEHCHHRIAAFYRYWDGKRQNRPMPSRADIDPAEIIGFLPGVILVDVGRDPFRLTYRLVGTREVDARGYDPTGKSVFEHCIGVDPQEIIENYRLVVEDKRIVFDPEVIRSAEVQLEEVGCLYLPLSTDGETVDMVLIYSHHRMI